jgi:sugar-specific transcriptional regulator TrmB
MNEKILIECGLTPEQAKIYAYLLANGYSPAKVISAKTGIGRAFVYKIIDQLITLDLVEKRDDMAKITLFFPKHPRNIKEMVEIRSNKFQHALSDLNGIFGILSSEFNALSGKPNIQFFEGVEGIEYIHEDILNTGQDILVMSSPIKEGRQEVLHLIKEQIEKQVAQNIRTKTIAPHAEGQPIATPIEEDEKYLITRKKVPTEKLNIPAQIIIYGDKVAITNFKESILTISIESKYIAETFRVMFGFIWDASN